MARCSCFSLLVGKKKKKDKDVKSSNSKKGLRALQMKLEHHHPVKPCESDDLTSKSFTHNDSPSNVKVVTSHESPVVVGVERGGDVAYEGEDEHEDNKSFKRNFSDFDLQAAPGHSGREEFDFRNTKCYYSDSVDTDANGGNKIDKGCEKDVDMIQSGHVSDPGVIRVEFWASPKLKRSCSNLERWAVVKELGDQLPRPSKNQSFEELQDLSERVRENSNRGGSPGSVTSHFSADKVMLKRHSSSQILPSRSRRLWWKLFLWSHRNLQKPSILKPQQQQQSFAFVAALNQQGGYCSDTVEPNRVMKLSKMESPRSFSGESSNKGSDGNYYHDDNKQNWDGFHNRSSALWPQNQWVAFPGESSSRVHEWVKHLEVENAPPVDGGDNDDDETNDAGIIFPPSPETGRSPARTHQTRRSDINIPEEILHANSVIQSLNSSSTVAHISGIGLNVIPIISRFSSLRSVNLSNNFIAQITAGSLPKGLHTLNLSRNKINTIEGLRELTRLRVLDLSYNRISRIGHGLSNCTLIKELYLAGNKISDIEGLHRLLKLTVLDMSFNKITTTKALGQIVANYQSLLALNLLGNPIQSNISDDQLRKTICSLLPKLVYLNKQPLKPQRARELLTDSVAKAVLGNNSRSSQRKRVKRTNRSGFMSSGSQRSNLGIGHATKSSSSRPKHQTHQQLPLKKEVP